MEKDTGMAKKGKILMHKYEVGKLLGQGTFAKVYHARNLKSGESVAIKVIDKEKILQVGLIDQIKREISVMRRVRHPNVVQLHEVMASKSKIYFAMEYVKGGELFNKVAKGRLKENTARKYFQQLVAAVDFCHSRGVYHRDLKPENLLLDENGNLKITDFGLSALLDTRRQDGLLHTTCGTPAYVSPEVINRKGYDGAKADIWSCGVILFVLLAGYLPFNDGNLLEMYKKISKGSFKCPQWFPYEVRKLLSKILDPDANRRITVSVIMENSWVKKGFQQMEFPRPEEDGDRLSLTLSDVNAVFSGTDSESTSSPTAEQKAKKKKPITLNAFHIISSSQGCDLSGMFENDAGQKLETRFTTTKPPSTIVSKLEELAKTQSFELQRKDSKVNLKGSKLGRKGHLAVDAEIFEITPALHVVEVKKAAGDTLEYQTFWDNDLRPSLQDIVWH